MADQFAALVLDLVFMASLFAGVLVLLVALAPGGLGPRPGGPTLARLRWNVAAIGVLVRDSVWCLCGGADDG